MIRYALLLIICREATGIPLKNKTRIVNGENTPANRGKYVVSLQVGNYECSGSLIRQNKDHSYGDASDLILTAAHCITNDDDSLLDPSQITVWLGGDHSITGFETSIGARAVSRHPGYIQSGTNRDDIAIIVLDTPIYLSETIDNIRVSDGFWTDNACAIYGWGAVNADGTNSASFLQWSARGVAIQSGDYCTSKWGSAYDHSSMVCIPSSYSDGGVAAVTCDGDSGGPIACNGSDDYEELVGVTNFGKTICTNAGAVFAYVPYYRDWIAERAAYWGAYW